MTYKAHLTGALVAASAAVVVVGVQGPIVGFMIAAALLGGVIPDADESESWISRQCFPLHWCFVVFVGNPVFFVLFGRRRMLRMLAHRGITHSIVGVFASSVLTTVFVVYCLASFSYVVFELPSRVFGFLLPWGGVVFSGSDVLTSLVWTRGFENVSLATEVGLKTGFFFSAGYLSHIILDMMTRSGCPLFCPFWTKRYHVVPQYLRITTPSGYVPK